MYTFNIFYIMYVRLIYFMYTFNKGFPFGTILKTIINVIPFFFCDCLLFISMFYLKIVDRYRYVCDGGIKCFSFSFICYHFIFFRVTKNLRLVSLKTHKFSVTYHRLLIDCKRKS